MGKILASGFVALMAVSPISLVAQPSRELPVSSVFGTWTNPEGSIRVQADHCGDMLCGWVISASAAEQRDAKLAGTPQLVGKNLLENYKQISADTWRGRVFVPYRGSFYYSKIQQIGANEIKISGCIMGGLICQSEVWHRVGEDLAAATVHPRTR